MSQPNNNGEAPDNMAQALASGNTKPNDGTISAKTANVPKGPPQRLSSIPWPYLGRVNIADLVSITDTKKWDHATCLKLMRLVFRIVYGPEPAEIILHSTIEFWRRNNIRLMVKKGHHTGHLGTEFLKWCTYNDVWCELVQHTKEPFPWADKKFWPDILAPPFNEEYEFAMECRRKQRANEPNAPPTQASTPASGSRSTRKVLAAVETAERQQDQD